MPKGCLGKVHSLRSTIDFNFSAIVIMNMQILCKQLQKGQVLFLNKDQQWDRLGLYVIDHH